ncbi:metal-binding protein [Leptolyngbya sp. 'hensonii']|uniref:metal-binding protein n=1 Tax=Leptolyngbya sp. 'hensonii' TaxID=1922337 RepID=UPI00094FC077|nr:metal-binding protein [Leptolyngbya sp. 'hensonii']OLP16299.1 metal-binding protein [Leptolyngbya sp. 'hensonii']
MPSGQTHDRITLWSLPWIAGISYGLTRNGELTLLVAGGFLFGGLMFGPDLDIYSRQYLRWGWVKWIWRPYQKVLRHRSFWSHGPMIGTTLRLFYLAGWISLIGLAGAAILLHFGHIEPDWLMASGVIRSAIEEYRGEAIVLFLGLELGSMSHSLSDWLGSAAKRLKQRQLWGKNQGRKTLRPSRKGN